MLMPFFLMQIMIRYPDLYVVSGGNEYEDENPAACPIIYISMMEKEILQKLLMLCHSCCINKSCVAVADIDKDGDADLFVGTLANAQAYGYPQSSYLLLNDGKGHFTMADNQLFN